MKEINIVRKDRPLMKATLESSSLSLLASQNEFEVMIQEIEKDRMFVVYPADEDSFEFFYILEGLIYSDDLETTLNTGDSFYFSNLTQTSNFKALDYVKILYVANEPVFHEISDEMLTLKDVISRIDQKDAYTKLHCNRVQELSFKIAKTLGLKGDRLESLQFASIFHDLGKVEIPDEILKKEGKLTEEEYDIIKTHSYHGSQIIKKLYFKNLEDIVLQHHERYDGSGYPNGLKGDEIMLEAAIIAVADTFDAMTSDRPYRNALDQAVAIKELVDFRGKHYHPDVVDAFIEVMKND